jgi:hypothetical protein
MSGIDPFTRSPVGLTGSHLEPNLMPMSKAAVYAGIHERLRALLEGETDEIAAMASSVCGQCAREAKTQVTRARDRP